MLSIALLIVIFLFVLTGTVLLIVYYCRRPNGPPEK
ncbi:MAG: hypothetical protein QOE46_1922 [Acidobacteriota bacterium]|jgi:hypothetical protein|nr:hypothetical protein [Acidobacteriota bacterium]